MRRHLRAAACRLGARVGACSVAFGVLVASTCVGCAALAVAEPAAPQGIASLVAAVADADQKLQDLGAQIQGQQESVNSSLVDVQTARDDAATAQRAVDTCQAELAAATAAIASAQKRFDTFAAATYVNGPAASYLTATDPADVLDAASTAQALAISSQQTVTDLQHARTELVNRESSARQAKRDADDAVHAAQSSQDAAVAALAHAQDVFKAQQVDLDRLVAERAAAQAKLDEARPSSRPSTDTPAATPVARSTPGTPAADWDRAPESAAAKGNWDTTWDPTLPAIPSAFVSGDPVAIINAILGIGTTSLQMTRDMGRNFLQSIGILPTPSGYTNGAIPRVYGREATEYVINRGLSVRGTPYSWGGGNAAGASRGIDSGAGTVGFDCSGLMIYMFAGVGIKLDHYSGSQYTAGRQVPSSQMRRGDMIFYGPNASQHVAMYLGDGQMLEAPYTGSVVKVSPVRTSGMTPYVTRLIEW